MASSQFADCVFHIVAEPARSVLKNVAAEGREKVKGKRGKVKGKKQKQVIAL
jgi:hypothetical protein